MSGICYFSSLLLVIIICVFHNTHTYTVHVLLALWYAIYRSIYAINIQWSTLKNWDIFSSLLFKQLHQTHPHSRYSQSQLYELFRQTMYATTVIFVRQVHFHGMCNRWKRPQWREMLDFLFNDYNIEKFYHRPFAHSYNWVSVKCLHEGIIFTFTSRRICKLGCNSVCIQCVCCSAVFHFTIKSSEYYKILWMIFYIEGIVKWRNKMC